MGKGNGDAFDDLAGLYERGIMGIPQDSAKANELYLKAGELGDMLVHITTWVMHIAMGGEWKLMRRKLSITWSWQL